jgi:Sigma-70 region 2
MDDDSIEYFHENEAFDGETRREHSLKEPKPEIQSNLALYRWRGPILDQGRLYDLLRLAKAGSKRAEQELFEKHHRLILKFVKRYHGPAFDDLVAAGSLGFSKAYDAFRVGQNAPFEPWHEIRNEIRAVVKAFRRQDQAGETPADRWLYHHPRATAEEVSAATGCTLADAEQAIARQEGYWHGHRPYDDAKHGGYASPYDAHAGESHDNDERSGRKHMAAAGRVILGIGDRVLAGRLTRLDAYLAKKYGVGHERPVAGRSIVDRLSEHTDKREVQRLREIGRRAYALELVDKERCRIAARSNPARYLYGSEVIHSRRPDWCPKGLSIPEILERHAASVPLKSKSLPKPNEKAWLPKQEIEPWRDVAEDAVTRAPSTRVRA